MNITSRLSPLLDWLSQPLPIDAYRTNLHPMWTSNARGIVTSITPVTDRASAIRIRTNRAWTGHQAGQFVTIGVEVDGVRQHRSYSLTTPKSSSGVADIEITVQRIPDGLVSTHVTTSLEVGSLVHLSDAAGEFTLPPRLDDALLFVSGGSGVTPIVSMLRSLEADQIAVDAVVVHFSPNRNDTVHLNELERLADAGVCRLSLIHTDDGFTPLDGAELDRLCADWRDRRAYVCGPPPLVAGATDAWHAAGVGAQLFLERFVVSPPVRPADAPPTAAVVRFDRSDVTAVADGSDSLLELAEASGVPAKFGCRTGVCHTCTTKLVRGCVSDRRNGRLAEAGSHVQLCVSDPLGDVALDL